MDSLQLNGLLLLGSAAIVAIGGIISAKLEKEVRCPKEKCLFNRKGKCKKGGIIDLRGITLYGESQEVLTCISYKEPQRKRINVRR